MDKIKRILAILGILLLLGLYGWTMVCAFTDQSETMDMFKSAVTATITVPILLWGYSIVFKWIKNRKNQDKEDK